MYGVHGTTPTTSSRRCNAWTRQRYCPLAPGSQDHALACGPLGVIHFNKLGCPTSQEMCHAFQLLPIPSLQEKSILVPSPIVYSSGSNTTRVRDKRERPMNRRTNSLVQWNFLVRDNRRSPDHRFLHHHSSSACIPNVCPLSLR